MRRTTLARLAILATVTSLLGACAVYEPAPAPGYYSSYYGPGYYYGPSGSVYVHVR
jgi:hypothetical protein